MIILLSLINSPSRILDERNKNQLNVKVYELSEHYILNYM
jgi:hypothetical protein